MSCKEGIVLVDKPAGLTSHDVVDFIRNRSGFKKVGHAGTLDPMATGLLIILLGVFTKKSDIFLNYDKVYEAGLCLGVSTDTGDKEGKIIKKGAWDAYAEDKKNIENIFLSFSGRISQVPPMYSAKKIKGKKLYEFARRGITLEREPKIVFIKEIRVLGMELPRINFYVSCSKGVYIRQLAHDIGEKIGSGAHLVSLKRTKIGPFDIKDALTLEELSRDGVLHENVLQPR